MGQAGTPRTATGGRPPRAFTIRCMARFSLAAVALAAALAMATGCGQREVAAPVECYEDPRAIAVALDQAPRPVQLPGGARLSECVQLARSDADIQSLGAAFTAVADDLGRSLPTSDDAALRLGYLLGATKRGAARTNGIHLELVRRLDQTVGVDGPPEPRKPAFVRGLGEGMTGG